ncbi:hypothetical protein HPB51_003336 [Rhipicephalus microplus]|uniref:Methyltransferase type 11 domain-containing protein n=1 Tax=Rhipicephalus microplus TaxID=6941 RepID=A0A9J6EX17_RHIMP|nr:hypothetical protein HPB51_003336 [Rhipicephalus microplus]
MNSVATIPKENASYCDVAYWDDRYRNEDTYDWLLPYHTYAHLIKQHVHDTDRILMLVPLSELLYKDGFRNIENIDYSHVVINNMSVHCSDCAKMKWHVMDATNLQFLESSFDVVIEKATIDSMMVKEKDPWNVSEQTKATVTKVSRVLRSGGRFISITFAQPHFRSPLYANVQYDWSVDTFKFGTSFHYFCYVMTKGRELSLGATPCYHLPIFRRNSNASQSSEPENEDFLLKILAS